MKTSTRMSLLVLGLFLIISTLVGATWFVTSTQKADGLVVNLAGRQRMLSQKAAKEALYVYLAHQSGEETAAMRQGLLNTLTVFEATLRALSLSGPAPRTLDPGGPKADLPKPSLAVAGQLHEVKRLWEPYRAMLEDLGHNGHDRVIKQSVAVLGAMNKAVTMLQGESEARVSRLLLIQGVGLGLFLLAALGALYLIHVDVARPLGAMTDFVECVAEQKEDKTCLEGRYVGELRVLRDALVGMVDSLESAMDDLRAKDIQARQSLRQAEEASRLAQENEERALNARKQGRMAAAESLRELAMRVGRAAKRLSDKIDLVSKGAAMQRELNDDAAQSLRLMDEASHEIAGSSAMAADNADLARQTAESGAETVGEVVAAIGEVQDTTNRVKASLDDLNQRADGIAQILVLINDIADQTNLLALNAAIEAARAGDAGRGFAVVADEVRKLAEKTMQATTDVHEAVGAIREGTSTTLGDMDKAVAVVDRSTGLAGEAGKALEEIVGIVGETSSRVRPFVSLAEEQSKAGATMTGAMDRITDIARSSARDATESLGELGKLFNALNDLEGLVSELSDGLLGVEYSEEGDDAGENEVFLPWNEGLSVGVDKIDTQHRRLVDMINDLYLAVHGDRGREAVGDIFAGLKEYVVKHFSDEEEMMHSIGYDDLENHREIHKTIVAQAQSLESRWHAAEPGVELEALSFLKEWLVNHIMKVDKRYSAPCAHAGIR